MDDTTRQLVSYAADFSRSAFTKPVGDAVTNHLVDSIACVVAGWDSEPARIATRIARGVRSDQSATLFGDGTKTTPEAAVFANTIMLRACDYNDALPAHAGAHPSDVIPALLAAGEVSHSSGEDVLVAIALAYEVVGALCAAAPLFKRGWDQGTYLGIACTLGVGTLLCLTEEQLAHSVALALVPCIPLRVTRTGALSMWKGCATAANTRHALFSAILAQEGMTGPSEPFAGKNGLWDQVTGPFELRLPAVSDGRLVAQMCSLKPFPAEGHAQGLLGLVPKIRAWSNVSDIASIDIETYWNAYHEIGSGPEKWDPRTRETADHSLPYLIAVALVDGEVTLSSFRPQRFLDPTLRPLMAKITVRENPDFTAEFRPPDMLNACRSHSRITVRTNSGRDWVEETIYQKGHTLNPMTREEIDAKFETVCAGVVSPAHRDRMRAAWWNIAAAQDISDPISTLKFVTTRHNADISVSK